MKPSVILIATLLLTLFTPALAQSPEPVYLLTLKPVAGALIPTEIVKTLGFYNQKDHQSGFFALEIVRDGLPLYIAKFNVKGETYLTLPAPINAEYILIRDNTGRQVTQIPLGDVKVISLPVQPVKKPLPSLLTPIAILLAILLIVLLLGWKYYYVKK